MRTRAIVVVLSGLGLVSYMGASFADSSVEHRIPVMIVGVGHLASHNDVHNNRIDDPLSAERQKQIVAAINKLAPFNPTKVLIEIPYGDTVYPQRYKQYLDGNFTLGTNEVYQYGFRLAAMAHDKDIYPIDAQGFPFEFDALKASADKSGQSALLQDAEDYIQPLLKAEDPIVKSGTILQWLVLLNEPAMLDVNASWYMYIDRVGRDKDYSGADLVSFWYARNLHIYANIARTIDSPNDRIIVIIGQGHASQLREYVRLSPDMQLVDPEQYLKADDGKSK